MKKFVKKDKRTELQKEYDNAVLLLKTYAPGSDEYNDWLEVIERMHALLMAEAATKKTVSPDALVNGGVGLLQVGAILWREQFHNVTSKALGFVTKGRTR